ncbi:MAG TPA: regulatory protein RecX [Candidatus Limnocylindria bacterium]|nr:regulatory protein RecX [Candidatus Limnocylindria bacterium]
MDDVVTEILKVPGGRLVRLSGGGSFKVPYALFGAYPLKAGQRLDTDEYQRQTSLIEARVALEQAARLLEAREKSRAELTGKLMDAGYSEEAAQGAADKLQSLGYLDDRRYAAGLIARLGKRYGVFRLKQELVRRGIPKAVADELLEAHDPQAGLEAAVAIARKALRGKSADPRAARQKAYAALARRGYGADVIRQALREAETGD